VGAPVESALRAGALRIFYHQRFNRPIA
jgi:hypothetical protein